MTGIEYNPVLFTSLLDAMKIRRLSDERFNLVTLPRWKHRDLVYEVLVKGRSLTEVARENGIEKQILDSAVKYYTRKYIDTYGYSGAMVELDQLLPGELAEKLGRFLVSIEQVSETDKAYLTGMVSTALSKAILSS